MNPLTCTIRVRSYELDSFGHVNNSVYLNYLEEARSAYLEQMGLSFNAIVASGIHIVIVDATVRYRRPAFQGDSLRIDGAITQLGAASVTFGYTLRRESDDALIATAQTGGACIDPSTGRPVRWPENFRAAFAAALVPTAG